MLEDLLQDKQIKITSQEEARQLDSVLQYIPTRLSTFGLDTLREHVSKNNFKKSASMPWYMYVYLPSYAANPRIVLYTVPSECPKTEMLSVSEFVQLQAKRCSTVSLGVLGGADGYN